MKTNSWIKMKWMMIKRFFIWMQLHHIKNFIVFWARVLIILIALFVAVWIWFTDSGATIGWMVSLLSVFVAVVFTKNNYSTIKRLNRKYRVYLKRLPENIRSMF